MRIAKYILVSENVDSHFVQEVQSWIDAGFVPYGNPYCQVEADERFDSYHCQAMVMYEKEE